MEVKFEGGNKKGGMSRLKCPLPIVQGIESAPIIQRPYRAILSQCGHAVSLIYWASVGYQFGLYRPNQCRRSIRLNDGLPSVYNIEYNISSAARGTTALGLIDK